MIDDYYNIFIGYSTRVFSDALGALIESYQRYKVVRMVPHGSSLVEVLGNHTGNGIIILEYNCPGDQDLDFIRLLGDSFPFFKILIISLRIPKGLDGNIFEAGVDGYLLKSCTGNDVRTALDKLLINENYFDPEVTREIVSRKRTEHDREPEEYTLTIREKEILTMLVSGETNLTIALQLGLSENTVKTHRRNIQNKFGVSNLLGMIRYACRSKLLDFGNDTFCLSCPFCAGHRC